MKKCITLITLLFFGSNFFLIGQELIFFKDLYLFENNLKTNVTKEVSDNKNESENFNIYIDNIALTKEEISQNLQIPEGFAFFQGLQSPFDSNLWIYLERELIGGAFNLKTVNASTLKTTTLATKVNADYKEQAFKPIAWTKDKYKIYAESMYIDSASEHEGIHILDLRTGETTNLNISFPYSETPSLSPDRDHFTFLGTMDDELDQLHGNRDIIYDYDLKSNTKKTIAASKGGVLEVLGWKGIQPKRKNTTKKIDSQKAAVQYYLPWDEGIEYCTSRDGTPRPPNGSNFSRECNIYDGFNNHGYRAYDFDTPNNRGDNVRASAGGTVSFSGVSGSLTSGFGRLVIIRHDDGNQTYYGHNERLLVSAGQVVQSGQVIAIEGTTGSSSGDHIHFERRAIGGNSATRTYVNFADAGYPKRDFAYVSKNGGCSSNLNFTSTIGSGVYRASNTISASAGISNGANVSFNAKNTINLTTGFNVNNGTNTSFTAVIGAGCASGRESSSTKGDFDVISDDLIDLESTLNIYPNPSSGIVNISFNSSNSIGVVNVKVYDVIGKLVNEPVKNQKYLTGEHTITIDVNNYTNGMYFFTFTNTKGVKLTKKILVQR